MNMRVSMMAAFLLACGLPTQSMGQMSYQERQQDAIHAGEEQAQPSRREAGFRGTETAGDQAGQQYNQELVNYLAARLYLANQYQVELAKMAEQKAQHPQVKQFAQNLLQRHQQLNQRLQQAMPGLQQIEQLSFNQQGGEASAQAIQAQRSGQPQGQQFLDGGAQTLVKIAHRAAKNNYEMIVQLLNQKQGQQFDRSFVAVELGAHLWMVAELKAIQDVGPEQFTNIIQQAEQNSQSRLNTVKQLADALQSEGQ